MTAERTTVACTVSRYESSCVVCSGIILPGERMFCTTERRRPRSGITAATPPSSEDDDDAAENDDSSALASASASASLAWGHEACHDPLLPPPPACRHWERLGRCPALELGSCAFRHDAGDRGSSASTDDRMRWGGRRRYVRNQHKNSVFRIFLMRTYGIDYVNRDGVVLDVAGGKGELSFELLNLSGTGTCVVVDPRPLNLGLVRGKWKKGLYEPRRVGVFSRWYPACEEGCSDREPRSPGHIRCLFDGDTFARFASACERKDIERTDELYRLGIERASRIAWTTGGLRHGDGRSSSHDNNDEGGETVMQEGTEIGNDGIIMRCPSEILDPGEARQIVRRCHLVVGLHPDQAAGEIIEFALAMRRKRGNDVGGASNPPGVERRNARIFWADTPPSLPRRSVFGPARGTVKLINSPTDAFPKRKLRDGTRVRTYDHLVEWLREKDPRARTATLDLEGKNTVVYSLPNFE
ncbi:hypothetical protein ACHAW5_005183 [Stephanodiscus triporus]|uniref:C3H1-type domain-containing protein n=1 Tax=Stephanodiscus triporus TaxID=2934178 RepID=A0ABD3P725_9STRA